MSQMTITRIVISWTGVILAIIGTGLLIMWDGLIASQVNKQFSITPTSQIFPIWQKSQDPVTVKIYLFNCTNTDELSKPNFKPNLVDVGPFIFKESNEKLDIVWNDNNTVSYNQKRTWHLDEENSANMNENITTLNTVPVAASYRARYQGAWASWSLSTSMKMLEKSIWITRPAREFLFEGYTDPLLTISSAFSGDKTDKMGFLYRRNGSTVLDGYFNIETGAEDISTVGFLRNWNYKNTSASYEEGCNNIQGYMGNFFKPGTTRNDTIEFFIGEICRTMTLVYERDEVVKGLTGYRFVPSDRNFDNGHKYEDTKCSCNGECMLPGVLNISSCTKGTPFFASFPHLLSADERYLQNVTGLSPSTNRSEFYVVVEPKKFTVNDESAQKLILVLFLPTLGTICGIGLILLGIFMLSLSLMPYCLSKLRRSPSIRKIDFTKDDMVSKELSDNNRNVKQEKKEYPLTECEYKKLLKAAENVDDLKASKETDILT
ncbi:hypothetical protein C0J52_15660 [Blattella germanica]|nr:hypothetical protein C0J52_15660 [Blattella germanica]